MSKYYVQCFWELITAPRTVMRLIFVHKELISVTLIIWINLSQSTAKNKSMALRSILMEEFSKRYSSDIDVLLF